MTRAELEKLISEYLARLQEARKFESEENARDDAALTWAIGLMGAGLFAIPSFLKAVTAISSVIATPRPQWMLGLAMAPWVLGVLAAIAGRLALRGLTKKHDLYHFGKSVRLQALLIKLLSKPVAE